MVIFNKPYSPDFNPIESVFSVVKNHYKRARFRCENRSEPYDQRSLIENAFRAVKISAVRNNINRSMRLLELPDVDLTFPKVV